MLPFYDHAAGAFTDEELDRLVPLHSDYDSLVRG